MRTKVGLDVILAIAMCVYYQRIANLSQLRLSTR